MNCSSSSWISFMGNCCGHANTETGATVLKIKEVYRVLDLIYVNSDDDHDHNT